MEVAAGGVPSVVYRISAPEIAVLSATETEPWNVPLGTENVMSPSTAAGAA